MQTQGSDARTAMLELREVLRRAGVTLPGLGVLIAAGRDYPDEHIDFGTAQPRVAARITELLRQGLETEQRMRIEIPKGDAP
jgi:hypothetical protein